MQRLTISLDDNIAQAIDDFMLARGYSNRSEAIRDLVRDSLIRSQEAPQTKHCVAAVSYVYDYDGRDLALRLDRAQHEHHDLTISSMRTRLDEDALQKIASTTMGEYFRAPSANELKKIYRALGSKLAFEKQRPTEVTAVFAGLGALLAAAAAMLSLLWFNRIL
jgi:nickel-responsive transcriptional regulator NikR